ncbi:signal peptidase II [Thomasclavelia cocleata]|uniref:signal peptidase II n=1 Tax=Thomasclavelia cocleata TaxID=69824 RepID=UPI00256EDD4C|nr:signal peptidase II [Thomasclavelia cocleata]
MYLIFGFIFCFLLFIDIATKVLATQITKSIIIIPDFFKLTYLENKGAAWGIGQNSTFLFIVFSFLFIGGVVFFLYNFKIKDKVVFFSIASVLSGAAGNLLDRIFNGYVIDFFDFCILEYNFPIFNVADICIVVGMFIIMFRLLVSNDDLMIRRKHNVYKNK